MSETQQVKPGGFRAQDLGTASVKITSPLDGRIVGADFDIVVKATPANASLQCVIKDTNGVQVAQQGPVAAQAGNCTFHFTNFAAGTYFVTVSNVGHPQVAQTIKIIVVP